MFGGWGGVNKGLQRSEELCEHGHHRIKRPVCTAEPSAPALPIIAGSVEKSSCSGNPLISAHKELLQNWRVATRVRWPKFDRIWRTKSFSLPSAFVTVWTQHLFFFFFFPQQTGHNTHTPGQFKAAGQSWSKGASQTAKTQLLISMVSPPDPGARGWFFPRLDFTDTNVGDGLCLSPRDHLQDQMFICYSMLALTKVIFGT